MVIFPTHRLVHSLASFDEAKVLAALDQFFDRTPVSVTSAEALSALRSAGERGNAYLMVTQKNRFVLTAKANAPWDSVPALPKPAALRTLDVAVLHAVILEHVLAISKDAQATQTNLRYSKDFEEAFASPARDPDVLIAFLMNPTKIEEVVSVAESGEVMPQKSTFFYPKIPSGLVFYPLD